jgi:hypothetical protein
MDEDAKYCGKCGMFLNKTSAALEHLLSDFAWIWRRSWAGFAAGFIGWIIVFIISRMAGKDLSPMMNNVFGGIVCGVFLGTAGGIIEDSAYKAVWGAVMGTIGGALGGLLNLPITDLLAGIRFAYPLSILTTWAFGGMFIGATSGLIEKDTKKMFFGAMFGLVGGALGGLLGSIYYGSLLLEFKPESWLINRLVEGSSGGLVGAILWFFIGTIEKFYIFRRTQDPKIDSKVCSFCGKHNLLWFWYCIACGKPLQIAAPREKIIITPYRGMERTVNAFRFLSWLFGVTGFVTVPAIFLVFLSHDFFLACTCTVFTVLASYLMVMGFRFLADLLSSLMKITSYTEPKA